VLAPLPMMLRIVRSSWCWLQPDVVAEGETGLLGPVGDVTAMADNVGRLLADPRLHAAIFPAGLVLADRGCGATVSH